MLNQINDVTDPIPGLDRNVPQYRVLGLDRFSDPIPIYQMIGISWGDPIQAAWELGIGIAQADPRFPRSCIVARPHYLGPGRSSFPTVYCYSNTPPHHPSSPTPSPTYSQHPITTPPSIRSPGLPHSRWVGLGIDWTPPGLPHSSFPAPALRFVAGYLIWRPPTLVASPFKRRVVLGLERTPPGLRHSSFPACPPISRCFAGQAAAAAAVVALGVVGSTWYPPPTTFICFSRCERQLVRA
ncbi:hypothetical protein PGT21_019606 [Puccinia graminis f. sp. tritici]|uniref:Uncharacterized protein n=1 Tax=Puccinia graminis f. sp. tritici TaxID=56615 RepID=A0A5B0N357_PUCGR|nr:hypothetical protein PGT21_019606 [Puccinia graminis f. sp. tritici]KAA1124169.1 hypothetical protein PGTUg99_030984 [Puccinia graminis f. sp. tritici]